MVLLKSLPKPPEEVKFGLKCPQSVLYIDLGFRGCLAPTFRRIYGIEYAIKCIVYDSTEKYFTFTDNEFNRQLSPDLKADVIAEKYIATTARNARKLIRTANIVSSPTRWRTSHLKEDLLEDLNAYWDAYEDHANSMYVFWGVEHFVMDSLIEELCKAGLEEEVKNGLPTFIIPSEPNWFVLEQQNLEILKSRFRDSNDDKAILDAATFHKDTFGIVYTPYNLGNRPSGIEIVTHMKEPAVSIKNNVKSLEGFPEHIVILGELVRQLAFWKGERTDTLSIADYYATPMYEKLSELLEVPTNLIYFMTRDEITLAITDAKIISIETLKERSVRYCRALINGTIDFYEPKVSNEKKEKYIFKEGDVIQGASASSGVVRGKVKIIALGEENPIIQPDEIIVTSMTRPELGAALDVALAYVTDEGGRLCHAAIVSREKKKPCIVGARLCHAAIVSKAKGKPCVVGTRKATEVLQNGMLIEVDGTKGIVTVL